MSQLSGKGHGHPTSRQRATQACKTCRARKVRCDAGIPKCSLCINLDVECIYLYPEAQRIDPSTRILLDRIQKLEDRMFPSSTSSSNLQAPEVAGYSGISPSDIANSPKEGSQSSAIGMVNASNFSNADPLTLPVIHNADSNSIYRWDVVQSLLLEKLTSFGWPESNEMASLSDATDVFMLTESEEMTNVAVKYWHIFEDAEGSRLSNEQLRSSPKQHDYVASHFEHLKVLVEEYITNFHVFYPILNVSEIHETLRVVAESEIYRTQLVEEVGPAKYCLLLMVLCLGSTTLERDDSVYSHHQGSDQFKTTSAWSSDALESSLWAKVRLLLGTVSLEDSLEAAQCFALCSIYLGSKGRTLNSHQQIHLAARKVGVLAKHLGDYRTILRSQHDSKFSEPFCRLFWVIYVYESDFAMELSLTPPSGITRFEELVPYPPSERIIEENVPMDLGDMSPYSHRAHTGLSSGSTNQNLAAFQISTNSAIRRFLNRITAVIYNPQEAWRKQNTKSYANWLLKVTNELQNHHEAIHANLPPFMVSIDEEFFWQNERAQGSSPSDPRKFSNHLWNVSRLRGRYCAGQYLICRASFELVLLNHSAVEKHPSCQEILSKCDSCIKACLNFVKIFSTESINCATNLFATGMATFAMVIILMISTTSSSFYQILPHDIDEVIEMGKKNLKRFSRSVKEFEWHTKELEKLDLARKVRRARNII